MKNKKRENAAMEEQSVAQPIYNHKPITRRDFLAQGYISSMGMVLAPSLLSMLASRQALAACGGAAAAQVVGKTPVIIFDLAGGANFAGSNVIVGKQGGQLDFLNDYGKLGLPPDRHPTQGGMLTTINGQAAGSGLAFHAQSDLLFGMRQTANGALANTDGIVFAAKSGDDTKNNPHNPAYWLYRAGARGQLVQVVGSTGEDSGGNSQVPVNSFDSSVKSVQISRPNDARGLVQLGVLGDLFNSDAKVAAILRAAENTSGRKLASFAQADLAQQVQELVKCGFVDAKDLVGQFSADALDPSQDPAVAASFVNLQDGDRQKTATVAKLVLDGYAGVGTIQLGGYDYHGGDTGRERQARKDREAGALIGSVLSLAAEKNKDVMIYIFTDGGVSANTDVNDTALGNGRYDFTSDSSARSSSILLVRKRDGLVSVRDSSRQVGAYQDNGAAVNTGVNQISDNVTNLAKAVVGNYLALHGEEGNLTSIVGNQSLTADMNQYVKFTRIR